MTHKENPIDDALPDQEQILESPRLLLEPLKERHAEENYSKLLNPDLFKFIPLEPPASREALAAAYRARSRRKSPDAAEWWLNWCMRLKSNSETIGTLEATIGPDNRALMAYTVFARYQRQGYAKEGCGRIIEMLFSEYHCRSVIAELDTRNDASRRLLEKLGFKRTAVKKNADYFKGSPSDEYRYELVES